MVQLKYFGDSRDYFKYDLITSVIHSLEIQNYVFVPMLTRDRKDKEGNKTPKHEDGKSKELLSFIKDCDSKDLNHWESWLGSHVREYKTVKPVNETFFEDTQRSAYWNLFSSYLKQKKALIFVDPDTGLESGPPHYLKKQGREKYILEGEVRDLYQHLDISSILMIYQHLPPNKNKHEKSVKKKLDQIRNATGGRLACAYREDDLAFIFMARDPNLFSEFEISLKKYYDRSSHRYKSYIGCGNQ